MYLLKDLNAFFLSSDIYDIFFIDLKKNFACIGSLCKKFIYVRDIFYYFSMQLLLFISDYLLNFTLILNYVCLMIKKGKVCITYFICFKSVKHSSLMYEDSPVIFGT